MTNKVFDDIIEQEEYFSMEENFNALFDLEIFSSEYECLCGSTDIDALICLEERYIKFVCNECGINEVLYF